MPLFEYTTPDGQKSMLLLPEQVGAAQGLTPAADPNAPPPPATLGEALRPKLQPVSTAAPTPPPIRPAAPLADPNELVGPGAAPGMQPPAAQAPGSEVNALTEQYLQSRLKPRYTAPTPDREIMKSRKVAYEGAPPLTPEQQAQVGETTQRLGDYREDAARRRQSEMEYEATALEQAHLADREALVAQQEDVAMRQARQNERNQMLQTLGQKINESRTAAENATAPTSDNFWKEKGAVGSLLAGIGIVIGGYLQGKTGGQNPALELVKGQISQYVADRKEEYALLEGKVGAAESEYGRMLQLWGDPETAEHMLRVEKTGLVAALAKNRAEQVGTTAYKQAAATFLDDWRAEQDQAALQAMTSGGAKIEEEYQTIPGRAGGVVRPDPLKAMEDAARFRKAYVAATGQEPPPQLSGEAAEKQLARKVRLPEGDIVWAKDPASATGYQGVLDSFSGLQANFARQRELIEKTGKSGDPAIRQELQGLVQSNKLYLKNLEQLGAITSADQELVSPLVGERAETFFKFDTASKAALETAERHARQRVDATRKNLYQDSQITKPIEAARPSSFQAVR